LIEINQYLFEKLNESESQINQLNTKVEECTRLKSQIFELNKINDCKSIFLISFDTILPTKCVSSFVFSNYLFTCFRENSGIEGKTTYFCHLLLNIMSLQTENAQLMFQILEYLDSLVLKATTLQNKV
jgi:hypothetical protein